MKHNRLTRKLNSRAGESLPEVLIAVLIVAMGMVMLGTLLNVSSRMVDKGQAKVDAVYSDVSEMDKGSISSTSGTMKIQLNGIQSSTGTGVTVEVYKGNNLISYGPKAGTGSEEGTQ